jgi:hypothetical protein
MWIVQAKWSWIKEAIQFWKAIALYYNKLNTPKVINHVPPSLTWHISQIIISIWSFIVIACILNESEDHWLLIDALNATISISLKLKQEMNHLLLWDVFINDDDSNFTIQLWWWIYNFCTLVACKDSISKWGYFEPTPLVVLIERDANLSTLDFSHSLEYDSTISKSYQPLLI